MSAKEMFEELGFTCVDESIKDCVYIYYYGRSQNQDYWLVHKFCLRDYASYRVELKIHVDTLIEDKKYYKKISMKEFKAIQKQLIELGWLDGKE